MITRRSSLKRRLPGATRLGSCLAEPKAARPKPKTIRNASTGLPVNTCLPRKRSAEMWERPKPARAPTMPPTSNVAARRRMQSAMQAVTLMVAAPSASAKPLRNPKMVNASVASKGAQVKVKHGNGWFGNLFLNSTIIGITSPSPSGNRTQPRTIPCTTLKPLLIPQNQAMPIISRRPGKSATARTRGLNLLMLTSKPAFSRTKKNANRWMSSRESRMSSCMKNEKA
mmetsp:Transcript_79473/g.206465  ORF Transcript_79473/g.206465 Transcript_79473/m.206465 type:complete len:227 (-) Transcript_79473:72-752(-)